MTQVTDSAGTRFRMERIELLLQELRYGVERGMLDGEIDETLGYDFIVPISKTFAKGVVSCSFRARPMQAIQALAYGFEPPKLRVVK